MSRKRKEKRVRKGYMPLLKRTMELICSRRITFIPFAALCLLVLGKAVEHLNPAIAWVVYLIAVYVVVDVCPAGGDKIGRKVRDAVIVEGH